MVVLLQVALSAVFGCLNYMCTDFSDDDEFAFGERRPECDPQQINSIGFGSLSEAINTLPIIASVFYLLTMIFYIPVYYNILKYMYMTLVTKDQYGEEDPESLSEFREICN